MTNEHEAGARMDIVREALVAITCGHRTAQASGERAGLRGRILGAARDRAWTELGRRLEELYRLCLAATREEQGSPGCEADVLARGVETLREARALARRLRGLGVDVDLSRIPDELAADPVALRCALEQLVALDLRRAQGDPEDAGPDDDAPDYQPSAAPSFLDSLAPR